MDFVSNALESVRRIKILTIVDDFAKEAVDLVTDFGISGLYVTDVLDQAARFRGKPKAIRTEIKAPNSPERYFDQWTYRNNLQPKLIPSGKPTQNAYIESFNGRFRNECLNDHWFTSLAHARMLIGNWHQDCNEQRPHSAGVSNAVKVCRMPLGEIARWHAYQAMHLESQSRICQNAPYTVTGGT